MDLLEGIREALEALGRFVVERQAEALQQQTDRVLTGTGNLIQDFLNDLLGRSVGMLVEVAVRGYLLTVGILSRSLLTAFSPALAMVQGVLLGAPAALTYGLPGVRETALVSVAAAAVLVAPIAAWSGVGLALGIGEDGLEGLLKRILGSVVAIACVVPAMDLAIDLTHGLGMALAAGTGGAAVGYAEINEAIQDCLVLAGTVVAPAAGPVGVQLAATVQELSVSASIAAGSLGLLYAGALFFGGFSAIARLAVVDVFYALGPLAMLGFATPLLSGVLRVWAAAFFGALLVVLPAGLVLKLGAGILGAMVASGAAGAVWPVIVGVACVALYGALLGKAAFGLSLNAGRVATRTVRVAAGR